jgi:hypothetical protein
VASRCYEAVDLLAGSARRSARRRGLSPGSHSCDLRVVRCQATALGATRRGSTSQLPQATVILLRGAKGQQAALPLALGGRFFPRIQRHTQRFRHLYRARAAVAREFGRLKHDYGLAPLRVRGLERVRLHADLTMLGRLEQALLRAREAMPVAA